MVVAIPAGCLSVNGIFARADRHRLSKPNRNVPIALKSAILNVYQIAMLKDCWLGPGKSERGKKTSSNPSSMIRNEIGTSGSRPTSCTRSLPSSHIPVSQDHCRIMSTTSAGLLGVPAVGCSWRRRPRGQYPLGRSLREVRSWPGDLIELVLGSQM